MPPTTVIAACSVPTCERVGRIKRGMCYPCYQLRLKKNPKPTSRTSIGKICRECKEDKPLTEYTKTHCNSSGIMARCRECINARYREWHRQHPGKALEYDQAWRKRNPVVSSEYVREMERADALYRHKAAEGTADGWAYFLSSRHKLTPDMFYDMLQEQGGGCAICGHRDTGDGKRQIHVDHDHVTGKVRGLLCGRCNRGLGMFTDDPDKLFSAIDYLFRTTTQGGSGL